MVLPYLKILCKKILHLFAQMEDELVRTLLIYHALQGLQVGIARTFILAILVLLFATVFSFVLVSCWTHLAGSHHFSTRCDSQLFNKFLEFFHLNPSLFAPSSFFRVCKISLIFAYIYGLSLYGSMNPAIVCHPCYVL